MAGFTKGPWRYDGYRVRSNGNTVADLRYKNGANDGRLIAAAPSMHDTLTFILTCDHDQLMSEGMDRVREALKLADGE